MSSEIHAGDVGTVFEVTVREDGAVVDISEATTLRLVFAKPNGRTVTKTATLSLDGTDGKMRYATIANDLDVVGPWKLQAFVVLPSGEWHSNIMVFDVKGNLEAAA